MVDLSLVGRCGLYCGACTIFRAYKDKGKFLQKTAKFFKCRPEKVKCEGCQALTSDSWGINCKIVKCLDTKGFEYCYECPDYDASSCEKFERISEGYLKEDNVDLRASLERIKAGDIENWLKESEKRFSCPHCGRPLSTYSRITECYHCEERLTV
ncbi:MAG: DUF3795 domain-containing protein [Promethearchaeota archaeon]